MENISITGKLDNKVSKKANKKEENGIKNLFLKLVLPISIIVIWQLLYSTKIVTTTVFASPFEILDAYKELIVSGELWQHISISLLRVVEGFAIGAILGSILGIIIGFSRKAELLSTYLIGFLRPIPMIAWIPVIILMLGLGEESKVVLIAMGSFWPVLINVISGIKQVDKKYLEVAEIFNKSKLHTIFNVILPSALPSIFTGFKLGISVAWMCVIGAEMVAASTGIGYYIMYQRSIFSSNTMLAGVFTIGVIGVLIDKILSFIEKKLLKWNATYKK